MQIRLSLDGEICDIYGMSHKADKPLVLPEVLERLPSEAVEIILMLLKRIDELESRLGMTPQNSSLPPSSQHPHTKPKPPPKSKSKKKRGGQIGHEKHERALVPPDRIDETIVLKPKSCRRCGKRLQGNDSEPLRHQVWELPKIEPTITEYQRHRLSCPCCKISTCAAMPTGVPEHQTGPQLTAFTALLMGCFRQSKRRVAMFCETILNVPCSTGLVVKLQNRATMSLRPAYEELVELLRDQKVLGIDESPTKEANRKSWLWTFVAKRFTVFAVRPTRKGEILDDLLTESFEGIVGCDRAKMYWRLPKLQWCWAHLKRDFQALSESSLRTSKEIGKKLLKLTRLVFRQWIRCRDGTISRIGLKKSLGKVRKQVEALLLRGLRCRHDRTSEVCRELYWYRERLWTFLDYEDAEPTNSASERALRHPAIWRKLSFGTQSESGSRFVETMLSVIETCRQQKRNVFAFVTESVQSHFERQPAPSLLPGVRTVTIRNRV